MEESNDTALPAVKDEPVKKLTTEERLEISNVYLQIQNLHLQAERMQADLIRAVQLRQELQAKMALMQDALGAKYSVDMTKVQIAPDGTITSGQ